MGSYMASKGLLCSKLCDSFINLFKAVENFFLCMDCTFGVTFHSFYRCYFAWKMSMLFLRGNNSQFNQKYINQDKFRLQALNWSFPQVDPASKKREHTVSMTLNGQHQNLQIVFVLHCPISTIVLQNENQLTRLLVQDSWMLESKFL